MRAPSQAVTRHDRDNAPGPLQPGRPPEQWTEDFFVYGIDDIVIAAGASATGSIQIQAESKFLWERTSYYATIANAAFLAETRPVPSVAIQIIDSGSGRQLFQSAQPIASIAGTGELPFLLPTPRYFLPNSQIQVTFNNFDAAVTYRIRLSLIGTKIFRYQG